MVVGDGWVDGGGGGGEGFEVSGVGGGGESVFVCARD